ncbi:20091_t:CDS:2, partial [Racocetra fulgida]
RVAKLEVENTKLKQIIEEIANLRIENRKLKQIINQNRTTNNASQSPVSPALSVTPQMPIPSSINGQSDKDDSTNSVNLEQAQIESEKTVNKIHDQNLDGSLSLSKPSINSDSTDPFEYNYDLSQPDKNQIVEQDLKQELSASPTSRKNITSNQNLLDGENQHNQVTAQSIVCMFRKAIQSGQEEILHWCRYIERYDKRVNEITSDGKVKIKTAKNLVYKEVKQLLPDITDANLLSVSANNIPQETKISSTPQVSIQTHDRAYFRNKILWSYSDLYKEFSSENFDYYGIHEGSLCRVCRQSHEEGQSIKGRYKAGSYFIKCGQQEIEITA